MSSFFFNLGKRIAPAVLKGRWLYQSAVGDENDVIRAEYQMGCQLAASFQGGVSLDGDPAVRQFLATLAGRLVPCVRIPQRRFAFRSVLAAGANAFALPGGFVYVSRPLLELCQFNPDEIAFVVGHEMAHVIYRHAADRVFALTVSNFAARLVAPSSSVMRGIAGKLVAEGYSRSQELEADTYAALLTRAGRFNPQAGVTLLRRLQELGRQPSGLAEFFASHPPFAERLENIQRTLAS
jgi:predicted Zn-dependent protease